MEEFYNRFLEQERRLNYRHFFIDDKNSLAFGPSWFSNKQILVHGSIISCEDSPWFDWELALNIISTL